MTYYRLDKRAILEKQRIERGECPKCGVNLAAEREVFGENHDSRFCQFTWADLISFKKEEYKVTLTSTTNLSTAPLSTSDSQ